MAVRITDFARPGMTIPVYSTACWPSESSAAWRSIEGEFKDMPKTTPRNEVCHSLANALLVQGGLLLTLIQTTIATPARDSRNMTDRIYHSLCPANAPVKNQNCILCWERHFILWGVIILLYKTISIFWWNVPAHKDTGIHGTPT
jgi:hypothetical protein